MQIVGQQTQTNADGEAMIADGSDAGFVNDVIEASKTTPVLVDFWAPWCGPCRQLTPALENAVRKADGGVKLVKINIDQDPIIAGRLGVRSIPAVFVFKDGQPVDGFTGALPQSEIDALIRNLVGGPDEEAIKATLARAQSALDNGDFGGAAQDFAEVLRMDRENAEALGGMAMCYVQGGSPEQAEGLLAELPEALHAHPALQRVRAALDLAAAKPESDELASLRGAVEANPSDHGARLEYAKALAGDGDLQAAADHLLEIVKADREWNDGEARSELLKVFEAAGPTSEVAKEGRRKLSTLLFS